MYSYVLMHKCKRYSKRQWRRVLLCFESHGARYNVLVYFVILRKKKNKYRTRKYYIGTFNATIQLVLPSFIIHKRSLSALKALNSRIIMFMHVCHYSSRVEALLYDSETKVTPSLMKLLPMDCESNRGFPKFKTNVGSICWINSISSLWQIYFKLQIETFLCVVIYWCVVI